MPHVIKKGPTKSTSYSVYYEDTLTQDIIILKSFLSESEMSKFHTSHIDDLNKLLDANMMITYYNIYYLVNSMVYENGKLFLIPSNHHKYSIKSAIKIGEEQILREGGVRVTESTPISSMSLFNRGKKENRSVEAFKELSNFLKRGKQCQMFTCYGTVILSECIMADLSVDIGDTRDLKFIANGGIEINIMKDGIDSYFLKYNDAIPGFILGDEKAKHYAFFII